MNSKNSINEKNNVSTLQWVSLALLIMLYTIKLIRLTWFRIEKIKYISIFIKILHLEHAIDMLKYEVLK